MSGSANGGLGIAVQESDGSGPGGGTANWRQSKWLAVGELVVVAVIFVLMGYLHLFGTTPYLQVAAGWISLRGAGDCVGATLG